MKLPQTKYLGFDDTRLVLIGVPLVTLLMSQMTFGKTGINTIEQYFALCLPISFVYTAMFWGVFRQIIIQFKRWYPKVESSVKRLIIQSITILVAYATLKLTVSPLIDSVFAKNLPEESQGDINSLIATIIVSFLIVAIYEGLFFYTLFKKAELEKTELERLNVSTQLDQLRNHVNPHFLFNSLNTLATLIKEDQDQAESFVHQLSFVYRYILEMRDKRLITLEEELKFLESYQYLLEHRFGDKMMIEIDIPDACKTKHILPLSLQILIENALKHNVVSHTHPLVIRLTCPKENKLVVENSIQRKRHITESTGFGIQNIKSRYAFYTDKEVDIIQTEASFIVILPLLEINMEEAVEI